MLKSRLILSALLGVVGGYVGTSMGLAGSVFGFFFGAVAGTLVFGLIGATIGWFAVRDLSDGITALDSKHPNVKPQFIRFLNTFGRGAYLIFGLLILLVTKTFGLFRK